MNPGATELHQLVDGTLAALAALGQRAARLATTDAQAAAALAQQAAQRAREALEQVRGPVARLAGLNARDVHDVVAHGLSLCGLLAGAAAATMPRDAAAAVATLDELEAMAAESRTELHRLLVAGHAADADGPDIAGIARRAGAGGQPVDVRLDADALAVAPERVVASARRIVRESITNACKHAPGAPVAVALHLDPQRDALLVEVANAAGPACRSAGSGRGLAGMHERARTLGGALHAGPTHDGGFRVRARLPIAAGPG